MDGISFGQVMRVLQENPELQTPLEAIHTKFKETQTKRYCKECGGHLKKKSRLFVHIKCLDSFRSRDGKHLFDTVTGEQIHYPDIDQ